ncbi:MAG: HesA/MoeB/ThiF family protein [Rikenellaceae bacterium]
MKCRYERNLLCNNFSSTSQNLLQKAKVLVVGGGGLGSYVLQHLTAVGVGTIGIVEFDIVSESNLNRQIIYTTTNIGSPKIDCAEKRLSELNPEVEIIKHNLKLTEQNIDAIISLYDMVVDCTDNFEVRYTMDAACEKMRKPLIHGSVSEMKGSVSTFLYDNNKNYRTLYGENQIKTSPAVGVLSPIVGVIGSLQAAEVIKITTGIGTPLSDKLLVADLEDNLFTIFNI